jgi:hypothetical protein
MSIIVANWSDKMLDELLDLLKASDYSPLSAFIFENFVASGNRIMDNASQSTLRVTVNGTDGRAVDLSPGVLQVEGFVSHVATAETINVLATTVGGWGTGQAADAAQPRWSLICIKNATRRVTPDNRWFVNDSVEPNSYTQQITNTEREMSYYDIQVVHGTPGQAIGDITVTAGYWCIAEVYVPADPTFANPVAGGNIYDTALISQDPVPHWIIPSDPHGAPYNTYPVTRVKRLEFWSGLFGVDHRTSDGGHKTVPEGGWHIGDPTVGANMVTSTANELNRLTGVGGTVTAARLTQLTDGTDVGTMHRHGGAGSRYLTMHNSVTQLPSVSSYTQVDLGSVVKQNGITVAANVITLLEGVKYNLSYKIRFHSTSSTPLAQAHFIVNSGDATWQLDTVSHMENEVEVAPGEDTIYWCGVMIPSVTTYVQLEVITQDPAGQKSRVDEVSIGIWDI